MRTSSSLKEHLQELTAEYKAAGGRWPATKTDVAKWALENGKISITHPSVIRVCGDLFGEAWREQHFIDPQGRSVRAMHAARIRENGKLQTRWNYHKSADRQFMLMTVQTVRRGIIGTLRQIVTDIDSYNENYNPGPPIQVELDFAPDIDELKALDPLMSDVYNSPKNLDRCLSYIAVS